LQTESYRIDPMAECSLIQGTYALYQVSSDTVHIYLSINVAICIVLSYLINDMPEYEYSYVQSKRKDSQQKKLRQKRAVIQDHPAVMQLMWIPAGKSSLQGKMLRMPGR